MEHISLNDPSLKGGGNVQFYRYDQKRHAIDLTKPVGFDIVGYIPSWLSTLDPEGAEKQIDKHYKHGGGFDHFEGFKMDDNFGLYYPSDPTFYPLAAAKLREELILFYPHAWVAVVQKDASFRIARID
jgi:hypothetical protein